MDSYTFWCYLSNKKRRCNAGNEFFKKPQKLDSGENKKDRDILEALPCFYDTYQYFRRFSDFFQLFKIFRADSYESGKAAPFTGAECQL